MHFLCFRLQTGLVKPFLQGAMWMCVHFLQLIILTDYPATGFSIFHRAVDLQEVNLREFFRGLT
jgi:hypothetical protein